MKNKNSISNINGETWTLITTRKLREIWSNINYTSCSFPSI